MARARNKVFACFRDILELYIDLPTTTEIARALNAAGVVPLCQSEKWDSRTVALAIRDSSLPWKPSAVYEADHHRARHPDGIKPHAPEIAGL